LRSRLLLDTMKSRICAVDGFGGFDGCAFELEVLPARAELASGFGGAIAVGLAGARLRWIDPVR
jgi:hypothetical protein